MFGATLIILLKAIILINMEEKQRLRSCTQFMQGDDNSARQQQFDLMVFRHVLKPFMMQCRVTHILFGGVILETSGSLNKLQ